MHAIYLIHVAVNVISYCEAACLTYMYYGLTRQLALVTRVQEHRMIILIPDLPPVFLFILLCMV